MITRRLRTIVLTVAAMGAAVGVRAVTCGGPYVVSGTGPYFTIASAVNAIPTGIAVTGDCIVDIQDSGSYAETSSVTVQNVNISAGRIIIGPQSSANRPSVNTVPSGVPIFRIMNASVTIQGLKIITGNNTFAINVSSPNVSISSVVISSSSFGAKGVILTSWSSIAYSTINAGTNSAVMLAGSVGTSITSCTITNNGTGTAAAALSILNSSSTVVSQSFIANWGNTGYAVYINASTGSIVTASTLTATGTSGYGIYVNGGFNDVFSAVYAMTSGGGTGLAAEFTSAFNETITQSTFAANSSRAFDLFGGSSNTVNQVLVFNSVGNALVVNDSYDHIQNSTATAASTGSALEVSGTYMVFNNNYINAGGTGYSIQVDPGADHNTISQTTAISASGSGATVQGNFNSISQSRVTTGGSGTNALLLSFSQGNSVTSSFIDGGANSAGLQILGGSANLIDLSTVTSQSQFANYNYGLLIQQSSVNVVSNSYILGSTGVVVNGSTGTTVATSIIYSTNPSGAALVIKGGSKNINVNGTVLDGTGVFGPSKIGIDVQAGNSGAIILSTNTIGPSLAMDISISTQAGSAVVWITSNTLLPGLALVSSNTFGIMINGLVSGATIYNNTFVYRNTSPIGNTAYAIWAKSTSGVKIDHNRIDNPGKISAGSFTAAYLSNALNTTFKFNDVYAKTTANMGGVLLRSGENSANLSVRNNIFASDFAAPGVGLTSMTVIVADAASQAGFSSNYNDFFSSTTLSSFRWNTLLSVGLGAWIGTSGQDGGSLSADPLWADPRSPTEDFHPKSTAGRWNSATSSFVMDSATSLTLDAGDPAELFTAEVAPSGGRVNQGSYGNTAEASRSPAVYAGCSVAFQVGAGQLYTTIGSAVAAIPTVLSGRACVVIMDSAVYSEQVTVTNFTNNGSSITIFADPGQSPTVSPPGGASAAFVVTNASVVIAGIKIVPTSAMSYGIYVSSPSVTISSVAILDPSGFITVDGIVLASFGTISYSSISIRSVDALYIPSGKNWNTVYGSSLSVAQAGAHALDLLGSSNTISQCMLTASAGDSVSINSGATYNTVTQSTMNSVNGTITINAGANYNSLTQNYVNVNTFGAALRIYGASNLIDSSNLATNSFFNEAVGIYGNGNMLSRSVVRNTASAAVSYGLVIGGTSNSVLLSSAAITSPSSALLVSVGASSVTVTQSYLANSSGWAALVQVASATTISYSTVTGGIQIYGSTATSILNNNLYSPTYPAVSVGSGSIGVALTSNYLLSGSTSGFVFSPYNGGLIWIASNTLNFDSAGDGVSLSTMTPGSSVWVSSNIFLPDLTTNKSNTALALNGLTTGATIQFNSIYYRYFGGSAANGYSSIWALSSPGITIHHNRIDDQNRITAGSYAAIELIASPNSGIRFNDIYVGSGGGITAAALIVLSSGSTSVQVSNNAFNASLAAATTATIFVDALSQTGFYANYNDYYSMPGGTGGTALCGNTAVALGLPWTCGGRLQDGNSFAADPSWFNTNVNNEDFHPRSVNGRWDPASSGFVADGTTSQTIDSGDPNDDYSLESTLNGNHRVNVGSYGNTTEASRSAVATGSSGCTTTARVGAGMPYGSISAAVASLPTTLTGPACIVIMDGASYTEQVTISGYKNSGSSITIFADPASGKTPTVVPPPGAYAAFDVRNSSVNIIGINIAPNASVSYGVAMSSSWVTLSTVGVTDTSGYVTIAGILLASSDTVANSTVIVAGAGVPALMINASTSYGNVVVTSSLTALGLGSNALYLYGTSNTVSGSYLASTGGDGVQIRQGSVLNTLRSNTVIALGTGIDVLGSSNTILQSLIIAGTGNGILFESVASSNTVNLSTVSASAAGVAAVWWNGSSNSVVNSIISNPGGHAAYFAAGATFNLISGSTVTSLSTVNPALYFAAGASSNTVIRSYAASSTTAAIEFAGASANTISLSTVNAAADTAIDIRLGAARNVITRDAISGQTGVSISGGSNANAILLSTITATGLSAVWIDASSTNAFTGDFIQNGASHGLYLSGGSSGNTVVQTTVSVNGVAINALYMSASSSNTFSQSTFINLSSTAVYFDANANSNTIDLSSITSMGSLAMALSGASSNTINGSFVLNSFGGGLAMRAGSNANVISASTFSTSFSGSPTVLISASRNAQIVNSYIQSNSTAVTISGSTDAVLSGNTLRSSVGDVMLTGGSVNLTLTRNLITNPGTAAFGIFLDRLNSGTIDLSTNIFTSGFYYGLYSSTQVSGTNLFIASNTFNPLSAAPLDAFGIYLIGASSVAVYNNSFYYQGSDVGAGWRRIGVYALSSSYLSYSHNRVNNPSIVATSNIFIGLWLDSTRNATVKYNDINASGTNIQTGNLLRLSNGASDNTIRDNIFNNAFAAAVGNGESMYIDETSASNLSIDYNDYSSESGAANTAFCSGLSYPLNASWNCSGDHDENSISGNPMWLSTAPASEDFHPRSASGRYTSSGFVNDATTSPTIDAGDIAEAFNLEASPNGARANQGSYGNTVEASKSAIGACAVIRKVCHTGLCASRTIQSAINSVPNPLQGYSCVLVEDAGTYPENIVISGFTMNGSSLAVMLDPALTVHPTVTPNIGTAGFLITNASVTLSGINVAPTASVVTYGIWATSANVTISSVSVIDLNGLVSEAAIAISSGVTVTSATVYSANGTPHGIAIAGTGASVSSSTVILAGDNGAASHYGVYLNAALGVTLTRMNIMMSNTGNALSMSGVNGAAISLSTFNAINATAVGDIQGSSNVTIVASYFNNNAGPSLWLAGSDANTITSSTMTGSAGAGSFAVIVDGSSNTFARSIVNATTGGGVTYIGGEANALSSTTVIGSTAVYVANATLTRISNSLLNGLAGAALSIDTGADLTTLTASTVTNNSANSPALLIRFASSVTVSQAYMINVGAGNAVVLADTAYNTVNLSTIVTTTLGSPSLSLHGASFNTFTRDYVLATSTFGVLFDAATTDNAINYSTIAAAGGTKYGLYFAGSQRNSIFGSVITGGAWLDVDAGDNSISRSTLTSVGATAGALYLQTASFNTVSQSYLANLSGTGATLGGGAGCYQNAIQSSVIISSGVGSTALSISGASTNVFTGGFLLSISGRAAYFSQSATSNTVVLSTITGKSAFSALEFASFSGSNSVTQSYIANVGGGNGAIVQSGADANLFGQDTFVATGASAALLLDSVSLTVVLQSFITAASTAVTVQNAALTAIVNSSMTGTGLGLWNRSSLNTSVHGSYVLGSTGAVVSGSTGTLIGGNFIVATAGDALLYTGGNTGITLSSNVIQGGPRSQGVWFDETNGVGTIIVSTNTILSGPQVGLGARGLAAGSSLWITSNTVNPTLTTSTQTAGIVLISLTAGATVQNNNIYYRVSGSMGTNNTSAIYANGSTGLTIDHNRLTQPGLITAGNYIGVELISSPGVNFRFNDVLGSGTGLGTPILLQLANSPNAVVKNNIFFNNMTASTANYTMALNVDVVSQTGFAADYNNFFLGAGGTSFIGSWGTLLTHPGTLAGWRATSSGDLHSIVGDPIWANIASGSEDFHLKSAAVNGRYNPATGTFTIQDSTTSLAIDGGDPAEAFTTEPNPNGLRANMGSYGNTAEASKSAPLAGCGTQFTVASSGGADYTSVNAALFPLIGTSLTSNACIVLTQTGIDNEEINVHGIIANNYRIIIMGHPALASRAYIDPGAGNQASFVIANDSVTIQNLDVIPSASLPYGIVATSASLILTDVNVDGGSYIQFVGIHASAGSAISYTSVTVQNAYAMELAGSGLSVSYSTAYNAGASAIYSGLYLNGAQASALTRVLALSANGTAVTLAGGSTGNTIAQSVFQTVAGAKAIYVDLASSNTITQSSVTNAAGQAVSLTANSSYNTISGSTLTAPGSGLSDVALSASGARDNVISGSFMNGGVWFDVNAVRNLVALSTVNASAATALYWQTASSNTLSQSYVFNASGDAVRLGGGAQNGANTISQSTMIAKTSGYYALALSGASTNTITSSVLRNFAGSAALFSAANLNILTLSSITSAGGSAVLYASGASSNTFSRNFVIAASTGVEIANGYANGVTFSTVIAGSGAGVYDHASAATALMNSYVEGSSAVVVLGSTLTIIGANVLMARSSLGIGMELTGGSVGLNMSSNTVYGGTQRAGLFLDAGGAGLIVISTNFFYGTSGTGVYIATQQAGTAIWFTSNTVLLPTTGANSMAGLQLNGLTSGATVANNAFYARNSSALGGATLAALSVQSSRAVLIDHNRFSNPSQMAGGSYSAIALSGSDQVTIKFNDIFASDVVNALTSAYLLQLIASPNVVVRNNVFMSSLTVTGSSATLVVDLPSQTGFSADYNDYFSSAGVNSILWGASAYAFPWSPSLGQDSNSVLFHPRWASTVAGAEDFHPLSQAGRYVPGTGFNTGDDWTAGTLDAADVAESFAVEPSPNGSRANLGSYGGTTEASKSPSPPAAPSVTAVSSTSITVTFVPVGAQGQIVSASTSPAFTNLVTSGPVVGQSSLAPQGLSPNTTYYLAAGALWGELQVRSSVSMTSATLAASPAINPGVTFTSVTASTIAIVWLANGNPLNVTTYTVVFSTGASYPNGNSGNVTFSTMPLATPAAASYGSLNANTTYYAFVAALNVAAQASAYQLLGSTATAAAPPAAVTLSFLAASSTTLTVSWSANGNPVAITTYTVMVSTDLTFSGASSVTMSTMPATATPSAQLSGLLSNTTYYLRIKANGVGGTDTGYVTMGSTSTWGVAPGSPVLTPIAADQITVTWSAPGNPSGTLYLLQTSTVAAFTGVVTSSYTYNLSVTTSGLVANTTYYFQAQAIANDGVATSLVNFGSVATLAKIPASAVSIFTGVASASLSVVWSANGNPMGTRYAVVLSTASDFNVFASSVSFTTAPAAGPSATFSGLAPYTTYYFEVAAVNHAGLATAYAALGSTVTLPPTLNAPGISGITGIFTTSMTAVWGLEPGATGYILVASTLATNPPSAVWASSAVAGLTATTATVTGLLPNTTYFLFVQAVSINAAGPYSQFTATATHAATPTAAGTAFFEVGFTSVTVSWSANGNPLAVTTYTVIASTDPAFGPVAAAVTLSTVPAAGPQASIAGLLANATYYFRVAAQGYDGALTPYLVLGATATVPPPPAAAALSFVAASSTTLTVAWSANGNPVAITTYTVMVSTDLTFSGAASVTLSTRPAAATPSAQLIGLLSNTTYYLRIKANGVGGTDSAYVTLGSTSTWAAAPITPVLLPIAADQITASWTAPGNPAATLYLLQTSTLAAFNGVVTSSYTYNLAVTTAGLVANTSYYFQALAIANDGVATSFTALGSTVTFASIPASAVSTFPSVASSSMSVAWSANGNPTGTIYIAVLSTASDFNAFASSVSFTTAPAAGPSATFSGLSPYTTYYFEVAAMNRAGLVTAYAVLGSTMTQPPTLHAPGISGITGIFTTSMTAVWSLEPGATGYILVASTLATNPPSVVWSSSVVAGMATTTATVTGLLPNTTYFLFVQAVSSGATGSYGQFAPTATHPTTPTAAGTAFFEVGFTSVTVSWSANGNPLAVTTYTVTASSDPAFGSVAAAVTLSTVPAAGPQASIAGLLANATYYFRVAAQGYDGALTPYLVLGATATAAAPPGGPANFSAVSSTSITLSWNANSNILALTTYTVVASTANDFNAFASSFVFSTAPAAGPSAQLSGLSTNTTYYIGAMTVGINGNFSAFVVLGTTMTAAQAPIASPLTGVTTDQITASWTAPTNPSGTLYEMKYSTTANFSGTVVASFTYNQSVALSGLTPNTTYFLRVAAFNEANSPTAFTDLGSTSTLVAAPSAAPAPITMVGVSSVTLNWLSGGNPLGRTTYILVASTAADFNAFASSVTLTTVPSAGLTVTMTGLLFGTSYYFQVAARGNAGEVTVYASLGSTYTTLSNLVPLIVDNQGGDAIWRKTNVGVFYDVSFLDGSGQHLDKFQVKASTTAGGVGTDLIAFTDVAVNLTPADAYATPWSLPAAVWNSLIEGVTNYITVRVFNNVPNSSTAQDAFYVRKDTTAPTIINSQSGDGIVRSSSGTVYSVSAYDTASGLASFQYSVSTNTSGDGNRISWTDIALLSGASSYATPWTVNFTALLTGATNYVSVRSWDIAGTTTTLLNAFYVLKDTTGPTVIISSPIATGYVAPFGPMLGVSTSAFPIQGTEIAVFDAVANLYWNPGSSLFNSGSHAWMPAVGQGAWSFDLAAHGITLTDGVGYKLIARSSTTFGQYSTVFTTVSFVYDASTPTASVSAPAPNSTVASVAVINGTAADPGTSASGVGSVEVQLERLSDGKWWNWFTESWGGVAVSTIPNGTVGWTLSPSALLQANLRSGASYFIAVRAVDNAVPANQGNFFVSGATFTYVNSNPPAAISDLNSVSGAAPGTIDLTWTATGENGSSGIILLGQYAVFYATAATAVPSTSTAQVLYSTGNVTPGTTSQYTLTSLVYGGTYYVSIALQDADGNWSAFSNQTSTIATPAPLNAILGHVVDASTNGITGVEINAWDTSGALISTTFTLADGSGTYAVAGLTAGTYKLEATWTVDGVTSSVWQDSISMGTVNVDFSLNINYALATLTGTLATLTTPASRVATTAQSLLRPRTTGGVSFVEVAQRGRTVSRVGVPPSGRWAIPSLLPGSYAVRAFTGVDFTPYQNVTLMEGETKQIVFAMDTLPEDQVFAFPNPAKNSTTFRFVTPFQNFEAAIQIFDVAGRLVREIPGSAVTTTATPGLYHADWDLTNSRGQSVASGVYLYLVKVKGDGNALVKVIKKLAVVR